MSSLVSITQNIETKVRKSMTHYFGSGGRPIGTGDGTKTDEFSEKFQMAFNPPPSFWKNLFKALYKGPKSAI